MDIQALIFEELASYFVTEDYPLSFKQDEFAKLRTFAERIRYCTQHLEKIAAGSGRIVFKIDDKMALKLAKNPKGVAQNLQEAQIGGDHYFQGIVAIVFNSDQQDQWVESELATKLKPTRFKQLTGVEMLHLNMYLINRESENNRGGKEIFHIDPQIEEPMHDNQFVADVVELMHNYALNAGDLGRLSSYGEVSRDGQPTVVVTDYGLSDEIYKEFYVKKPKRNFY